MRLDQEVRHKSEDIEDAVLLDAVQAIRRRVRIVNREYNIPISPATAETDHSLHRPACARLCTRPVPTGLALTTTIGTDRGRVPALASCIKPRSILFRHLVEVNREGCWNCRSNLSYSNGGNIS